MTTVEGTLDEVSGGSIDTDKTSDNSVEIDDLGRFAVDKYNKQAKNTHIEYGKVLHTKEQIVAGGTMYYLFLLATDGGKKKLYEAKVFVALRQNSKELKDFKQITD